MADGATRAGTFAKQGLRRLSSRFNVNLVKDSLGVAFATANNLVAQLEDTGVLTEITGGRRRRVFRYDAYLALLSDDTPARSARRG